MPTRKAPAAKRPSKPHKKSKRAKAKVKAGTKGDSRVDRKGTGKGSRVAREQAGTALPKMEPDTNCNGLTEDRSSYCEQPAGWGTEHPGIGRCKRHGGSTELANRGAAMQRALQLAEVYGTPEQVDPHTALLNELERTSGHVSWLFIKVQEVGSGEAGEGALVGPVGQSGPSKEGGWHHASIEPSVWLKLYQDERKHLVSVANTCVRAGIEERRVRIAEAQGMMIARAIQRIVTRLGVHKHPELAKIVREELMALSQPPQPGAGPLHPELEASAA